MKKIMKKKNLQIMANLLCINSNENRETKE